jgi:hypothetical protein
MVTTNSSISERTSKSARLSYNSFSVLHAIQDHILLTGFDVIICHCRDLRFPSHKFVFESELCETSGSFLPVDPLSYSLTCILCQMFEPENNEPIVGAMYNGSRVVDVQVEVSDRGTRVRKRSTITLENGAILTKDHFKEKKFEELDTKRRRAPPRTRSNVSDGLPQRSLPKSKSGRQLPKPIPLNGRVVPLCAESPTRGEGRIRTSSRGREVIVCETPLRSKKSDLNSMTASPRQDSRISRQPPRSPGGSYGHIPGVPLSPETTLQNISLSELSPVSVNSKEKSSFRNLQHFLASPKRKPPTVTKSGSDLNAMRSSLHSCTSSKPSSSRGDGDEDTPKKPRSLKKLGQMIQKNKVQIPSCSCDNTKGEQRKKEDRPHQRRRSTATAASNKEKLKSFKEMISITDQTSKSQTTSLDVGKRRSSLPQDNPPVTPKAQRRSIAYSLEDTGTNLSIPQREPSLSPAEVKKPSSAAQQLNTSYVTNFLDKLYDSYMKDDDGGGSDDDSDEYDKKPRSLLDMGLNKFVDWVE